MRIAGVTVEGERLQQLMNIVATPAMAITDGAGYEEVPGDDLPGFVARALGLEPAGLTVDQRAEIDAFIADFT